jgi:hypothetical protein
MEDKMKVEPIKSLEHIAKILNLLEQNKKLKLLFFMSINNDVGIKDILSIKINDVINFKNHCNASLTRNNKKIILALNNEVTDSLNDYFNSIPVIPDHYLFQSRKGKNYPLTTHAVMVYVKGWCTAVNLEGNFGAGSLRKTYKFHNTLK